MTTATTERKLIEKPPYYPTLATLVGETPPKEGERVYDVRDATGRHYFVKSNSPGQAVLQVCTVELVPQKRLIHAMTEAILLRSVEEGGK